MTSRNRSAGADAPDTIRFGPFELDTDRFELRRAGVRVAVEPRTLDLIALLARNQGRLVTRDEIVEGVWGGRVVSEAAISSQVSAARKVLGDSGTAQGVIATVHGRGFRLRRLEGGEAPPPADSAPVSRRPRVAVFPFANLDQDGRGAICADGMTEDVITALTRHRWLNVIARGPAFAFRDAAAVSGDAALRLGADYSVTGSLRRNGRRIRVSVQASDARSGRCIWAERFDREMEDVFDLQEEISGLIAARLANELGLTEQRRAARAPRRNLGAWELYQLGSAEFFRFTRTGNLRCQELLRQAIRLDPEFADPHSRLAYAMILGMVYFEGRVDEAQMDEALALAIRGTACDEEDANAWFSLGRVRLARCEYALAMDALETALQLNPCLALSYCGMGDSLAYEGRLDEAILQFERAIALSPHDPFRWAFFSYRSLAHLFAGDTGAATRWARKAVQVPNAHYWARANLTAALGHQGDTAQARNARQELLAARPGFSRSFARERLFFVKHADQIELFIDGLARAGVPP